MAASDVRTPTEITLHAKSRVLEISFSDGHATGIYSWDYLYELGTNREPMWRSYLERLKAAGSRREP